MTTAVDCNCAAESSEALVVFRNSTGRWGTAQGMVLAPSGTLSLLMNLGYAHVGSQTPPNVQSLFTSSTSSASSRVSKETSQNVSQEHTQRLDPSQKTKQFHSVISANRYVKTEQMRGVFKTVKY